MGTRFLLPLGMLLVCAAAASPQGAPTSIDLEKQFTGLGNDIGRAGIAISDALGVPEIYLSDRAPAPRWMVLHHDPSSRGPTRYRPDFVSEPLADDVVGLDVGKLQPGSSLQVALLTADGYFHLIDQASRAELLQFWTGQSGINRMRLHDMDNDGVEEILVLTGSDLKVFRGTGLLLAHYVGIGGVDLRVAQMDSDASLEIAVNEGEVIDYVTGAVQWNRTNGFANFLATHDLDNDGDEELFGGSFLPNGSPANVVAFDVEAKRPVWRIVVHDSIDTLDILDVDGNGIVEMVCGNYRHKEIVAVDLDSGEEVWGVESETGGINAVAFGDVDNDGVVEVVWGAGHASNDLDHLYVGETATGIPEWGNLAIEGPFSGPTAADTDGDGVDEYFIGTFSGWTDGHLLQFDEPLGLIGIQPRVGGGILRSAYDVHGSDLDGDGHDEVLVAAESGSQGLIEAYGDTGKGRLDVVWTTQDPPQNMEFSRVVAADVDVDGSVDIVVGNEPSSSDTHVLVFDYPAGMETWRSLALGTSDGRVSDLLVQDFDGDAIPEIVAVVEDAEAWIFDGATKNLEGLLFGGWRHAAAYPSAPGQPPTLLLGSDTGVVAQYDGSGGPYQQVGSWAMSSAPIDGLTVDGTDLWVGSGGRLSLHPAPLSATPLLQSAPFGPLFGGHVLFGPGGDLFTAGATVFSRLSVN